MKFNTCLSEISEIVMGQSPKGDEVNNCGKGVPLLNGPTEFTDRYPEPVQFTESGKKFAEKGDILFCVRGSTTGRMNYADQKYAIGRGIGAIRGGNGFPTPYVRAVIEQNLDRLLQAATGSTFPNVGRDMLNNFEVASVGQEDANRINQFIVSLEGKVYLNSQINQTLEQMAQAIFKSWFVDFEPVKAKMAALAAGGSEDDALLAAMQAIAGNALFTSNAADADAATQLSRLQTEHPEQYATLRATAELFPSAMQESELGEIPMGWEAGSIGDIATVRGGYAFKGSQFEEHGNPVVKIKNIVGDGTVKLTGTQCVDDAVAETAYRFQLNDGDLVMAMTGATVGKTGLVLTLGEKVFLNQRVAVFQSKYFGSKISWFLFCLFARKDIFDVVVGTAQGSAQPNISSSGIEAVPIVVPAHEVLEKYLSITDGLFKSWLENNRQSENLSSLRDTLLPKLLSGELSVSAAADQITQAEEAIDV